MFDMIVGMNKVFYLVFDLVDWFKKFKYIYDKDMLIYIWEG